MLTLVRLYLTNVLLIYVFVLCYYCYALFFWPSTPPSRPHGFGLSRRPRGLWQPLPSQPAAQVHTITSSPPYPSLQRSITGLKANKHKTHMLAYAMMLYVHARFCGDRAGGSKTGAGRVRELNS